MVKRGKSIKPSILGESDGAGAKRGRDGAASLVAAKASEQSGDDRFSLSKFQLDERFKGRKRRVEAAAAVEVEESEEEQEHADVEDVEEHDEAIDHDDDDDDDDDGDDDDGNYDIDKDDDAEEFNGAGGAEPADAAAASSASKKLARKLKPMSPEELAAFMKVLPPSIFLILLTLAIVFRL
jgi:archaellum component FlaD/FlaE